MKETVVRKYYDAVEKQLESYPDVFADIINALVYEGRRVLRAENLRQAAQETLYKGAGGKLRRQFEDIAKCDAGGGSTRVQYLLANQTAVNKRMLLRKKGYEGGAYQEQYEDKVHYICPVIELILYWGEPLWKGTRTIRGLFAGSGLEPEAWDYIDDDRFSELARQLYEQQRENGREGGEWKMCELVTELIEQGRAEGIQQGIQNVIATCKYFKASFEQTAARIREQYHLDEEAVQRNMELYW